jgi:Flp pilus assembly protein CpaB
MEVPSIRNRIGGNMAGQLLSSRRGALTVAAVSALLAGLLLYMFVQHYRTSPVAAAPTQAVVFVASQYIPAGTPESLVASENLLKRVEVPSTQAVAGAIPDPSTIAGEYSSTAIAAGQQISIADFTHSVGTVGSYLSGKYRAVALPFDAAHGLTAYLQPGNTVDIMDDESDKTMVVVAQNVPVLANANGEVVLKVRDSVAMTLAGASDNSKLWLTLRPPAGARQSVQVGSQIKDLS